MRAERESRLRFPARAAINPAVKAFDYDPFVLPLPLRFLLLFAGLALAACATLPSSRPPESPAPAAAPAVPAPPTAPAVPALRSSRQICGVELGRTIALSGLGLPEGSRPLALALARDTVWLLFEPALLVGLPREVEAPAPAAIPEFGAVEALDLVPGPAGVAWSALAVDASDGSVWLVAETAPGLWRKRPGRRPEAVPLPAAPAVRQGGFRSVLAGRGSVWVAPVCADSAVWRLAPTGKLLGKALDGAPGSCSAALLQRDWAGTAWALQPAAGEVFRMGFDLAWQPAAGLPSPAPAPPGSPPVRSWFFWGGEPFGLAAEPAAGTVPGEVLLVHRTADRVEALLEKCGADNALVDVTGDERGWAILTRQWLRLADHQRETATASPE